MSCAMGLCLWWRDSSDLEAAQNPWPLRNFADNQDAYRDAFGSMFKGRPKDAAKNLAKLLRPDFYMESAGLTLDFPEFVDVARKIRAAKLDRTITVVMFLRDGQKLAAYLVRELRLPDGSTLQDETWHFGMVHGDGRIAHLVETKETSWKCDWDPPTPGLIEEFASEPED